jgi:hypothetical protein
MPGSAVTPVLIVRESTRMGLPCWITRRCREYPGVFTLAMLLLVISMAFCWVSSAD